MVLYDDILCAHVPGRCDAPVVLFWPKDQPAYTLTNPAKIWKKICQQLEIVAIPGDHTTAVSQNANVEILGEAMRKSIARAENVLTQA